MDVKRLAIYQPGARPGLKTNVFGATVANFELFRALLLHAGLDRVDVLTDAATPADEIRRALIGDAVTRTEVASGSLLDVSNASESGVVVRGSPKLEELAWQRRQRAGDDAYSLIGLIHTMAPPMMRQDIAQASIAPVQPWDALVCTSPSVQRSLDTMFGQWENYLGDRFRGARFARPQLPLIPLGVDADSFADAADRPDVRAAVRSRLGVSQDDILILWVGRLSFFEKAFPQPMFRAIAKAAAKTGVKAHFVMVGWFPGKTQDEDRYREAAARHAPEVAAHFLDGNDPKVKAEIWAAADIFLSLIDNIQETFGITPLEAMAAGLPVVVSDWDGYRYTVEHGRQGFLIPTLGGGQFGLLDRLSDAHSAGQVSYQQYVGTIAQHTAVSVPAACEALCSLIESHDLRRKMGQAGRRRVRTLFDWRVVAPQYRKLAEDLTDIRAAHGHPKRHPPKRHPLRGDPFVDFREFPSHHLTVETPIGPTAGWDAADIDGDVYLDNYAAIWRASREEAKAVLSLLDSRGATTVRAVLETFPVHRRKRVMLTVQWLCKSGLIDWEDSRGDQSRC